MNNSIRVAIVLASFSLAQSAYSLQLAGEIRIPYNVQVTFDSKAKTLEGVGKYVNEITKLFGSKIDFGSFDEVLTVSKDGTYQVNSTIPTNFALRSITPLDKIIRSGEGKIVKGIPVAYRVSEQRGSTKQATWASVNEKAKKVIFQNGKEEPKSQPLPEGGVTDLVMMSYLFFGSEVPVKPFRISMVDSKRLFVNETMLATELPIVFNGETFPAVKFTRAARPGEDAYLEIWLRKSDGAPVRLMVGLSAKYGAVIDIYPRKLPPLAKTKG